MMGFWICLYAIFIHYSVITKLTWSSYQVNKVVYCLFCSKVHLCRYGILHGVLLLAWPNQPAQTTYYSLDVSDFYYYSVPNRSLYKTLLKVHNKSPSLQQPRHKNCYNLTITGVATLYIKVKLTINSYRYIL